MWMGILSDMNKVSNINFKIGRGGGWVESKRQAIAVRYFLIRFFNECIYVMNDGVKYSGDAGGESRGGEGRDRARWQIKGTEQTGMGGKKEKSCHGNCCYCLVSHPNLLLLLGVFGRWVRYYKCL